jgi:hypothetical protein
MATGTTEATVAEAEPRMGVGERVPRRVIM